MCQQNGLLKKSPTYCVDLEIKDRVIPGPFPNLQHVGRGQIWSGRWFDNRQIMKARGRSISYSRSTDIPMQKICLHFSVPQQSLCCQLTLEFLLSKCDLLDEPLVDMFTEAKTILRVKLSFTKPIVPKFLKVCICFSCSFGAQPSSVSCSIQFS